jgi:hypothetical protein
MLRLTITDFVGCKAKPGASEESAELSTNIGFDLIKILI